MFYYLIAILLMGIITFIAYANDKRKAKADPKHRTREKTLLLLSFLLGSVGGLLGMYVCRHKTKHWYFVVVNWLSLIIHIALGWFMLISSDAVSAFVYFQFQL